MRLPYKRGCRATASVAIRFGRRCACPTRRGCRGGCVGCHSVRQAMRLPYKRGCRGGCVGCHSVRQAMRLPYKAGGVEAAVSSRTPKTCGWGHPPLQWNTAIPPARHRGYRAEGNAALASPALIRLLRRGSAGATATGEGDADNCRVTASVAISGRQAERSPYKTVLRPLFFR